MGTPFATTFTESLNLDALLVDDAPTKSMNRLPKEDGGAAEVPRQEAEAEAEAEGGSNFIISREVVVNVVYFFL